MFTAPLAVIFECGKYHSPYRLALGLDAALAEIEQNKGRLFDPETVDACLVLFRSKRFSFEEATPGAAWPATPAIAVEQRNAA